jgi:hypothetical protein
MRMLISFLLENPILLGVVVLWIVGGISNIRKAVRAQQERMRQQQQGQQQGQQQRQPEAATTASWPTEPVVADQPRPVARPKPAAPTEADIRRDMQAILARGRPRGAAADVERAVEEPTSIRSHGDERPPAPMTSTTSGRRLTIHVDPHVGEGIARRAQAQRSKVGAHAPGTELGSLGGRTKEGREQRAVANRYPLTDLRRLFVMNEILGKPLALRESRER